MDETKPKGLTFIRRIYLPRVVGLGLGFFCVASVLYQQETPALIWIGLIFNGFIWPHLAYLIAKSSRNPYAAERRNLLIDSVFGGVWVPLMSFNLVPSVVVIVMLSMDNIAVGGGRLFIKGITAHLIGGLLAILFFGLHIRPESNMANVLACLPMLAVFPLSIGMITYRLTMKLSQQRKAIEKASIEIKDANERLTAAYEWMRNSRDHLMKDHDKEEIGFVVDQAGKIERFTERALECIGKPRAAVAGTNIMEFIDAASREEFKAEFRNAWMGIARNFAVVLLQPHDARESFEVKLMRLTSEFDRTLLVIFRSL
jgi:hypothetical protein